MVEFGLAVGLEYAKSEKIKRPEDPRALLKHLACKHFNITYVFRSVLGLS